jgi:two-component system, NtrC family, sensor histidine kinase HydH
LPGRESALVRRDVEITVAMSRGVAKDPGLSGTGHGNHLFADLVDDRPWELHDQTRPLLLRYSVFNKGAPVSAGSSRLEFLGQLAGGLAHEIKNPLSTIKLTLQLLEEDMHRDKGPLSQRSLPKIEVLLREVAHLDEVVQEFLAFARGHELKLTRTNLRELVVELFEFLADDAQCRNIRLRFDYEGSLDDLVFDRTLIRQALMNLLRNAFDAIGERRGKVGGEVIVRARVKGELLGLEVVDTGVGIAPSNYDRMFRPYFTTKKTGTGMGLPMVRRIVEEHGGQITFESEQGKGTRFVILLPADPEKRGRLKSMVAVPGEQP